MRPSGFVLVTIRQHWQRLQQKGGWLDKAGATGEMPRMFQASYGQVKIRLRS